MEIRPSGESLRGIPPVNPRPHSVPCPPYTVPRHLYLAIRTSPILTPHSPHSLSANVVGRKRGLTGDLAERKEQYKKRKALLQGSVGSGSGSGGPDGGASMAGGIKADTEDGGDPNGGSGGPLPSSGGPAAAAFEVSAVAKQLMAKMGHKDGEGIGKMGQGISRAIEVSSSPTPNRHPGLQG